MVRFRSFARPHLGIIALGLVLLLLTNALALSIPWLLRSAINAMQQGDDFARIGRLALAMMAIALLQAVVRTGSRLAILGTSRRIACDIRAAFFRQLQRLDAAYYDTHRTGDIMSRGVNDIQLIQSFFGPGVMNLLNTGIIYSATLVLLLRIDVSLTIVSLLLFPVLFFVVNRLSRRVFTRSRAVQEQLATISNRAQENISGIQQVKAYVQEEREIRAFRELCLEFRRRNLSMAAVRGAMISLIGIVTGVGTLIVLFVGGSFVIRGRISFGDYVAFNTYLGMLTWPTIALGWIINTFQRGAAAMERLQEVFDAEPRVPAALDEPDADAELEPVDGEIEFRNLTFTFDRDVDGGRAHPPALEGIDLKIPQGSRIALVGPVGSGKSTLAALVSRTYEVPRGTLFIGGRDVRDLPVSRVRRSVGFVPQESFLFSRSIRENLLLARPDATESELLAAVEVAGLEHDLASFPKGIDTIVGERGLTLSGGQRQRTTLARAVVRDPRILILDDSLSSVDADTERAILARLDRLMRGRTSILITHRFSTLTGMDRIVVLERGRVVEQGTHDQLVALGGVYERLFRRQRLAATLDKR